MQKSIMSTAAATLMAHSHALSLGQQGNNYDDCMSIAIQELGEFRDECNNLEPQRSCQQACIDEHGNLFRQR